MNKVIFTGPTQYLGGWHFTRGKIYDMNNGPTPKNPNNLSINRFYIISDNEKNFYMNSDELTKSYFILLDKWREIQVNKILNYE